VIACIKARMLLALLALASHGNAQDRVDGNQEKIRYERQLRAVIEWEILWNDTPAGFQAPEDSAEVSVALDLKRQLLSYCGSSLGVCVRYRIDANRNWQRDVSRVVNDADSNEASLEAFSSYQVSNLQQDTISRTSIGTQSVWNLNLRIRSRDDIVRRYRALQPEKLDGLRKWITTPSNGAGRNDGAVTIACFDQYDPITFYSVRWKAQPPIIMAVFWDNERREWIISSWVTSDHKNFEDLFAVIELVPCSRFAISSTRER
jgi:type II secretory pathway pseudopilin PulG